MGWKTIKGRRYYYKSERDGGRVKTTYFGAGESGLLTSLLQLEDRAEFGLSRFSASRGLDQLERAELVSVGRMPGRSPVVIRILDATATNG